jgi:hypothetical protein
VFVELRYAIEVDQEFMTVRQNADADQLEARLDSEDQQHGWPAWLLSVVLHATLLIACSLIVPAAARLPPGEPERTVGIALVPHSAAEEAGEAGGGSAWSDAQAAEPASQGSADASRDFLEKLPSLDSFSPQFASSLPQTGSSGAGVGLPNAAGLRACLTPRHSMALEKTVAAEDCRDKDGRRSLVPRAREANSCTCSTDRRACADSRVVHS